MEGYRYTFSVSGKYSLTQEKEARFYTEGKNVNIIQWNEKPPHKKEKKIREVVKII
jgi:hypothetical protein